MIVVVLGLAAVLAGCGCLYLASPHQRLRASAWPWRWACAAGLAFLAGGLLLLMQAMMTLAAVFTFLTALMLGLMLLPYVAALFSLRRRT